MNTRLNKLLLTIFFTQSLIWQLQASSTSSEQQTASQLTASQLTNFRANNLLQVQNVLNGSQLNGSQLFVDIMLANQFTTNGSSFKPLLSQTLIPTINTDFSNAASFTTAVNNIIYSPCCNQTIWNDVTSDHATLGSSLPMFCKTACPGTNCITCNSTKHINSNITNCNNAISYFSNNYQTASGDSINILPYSYFGSDYINLANLVLSKKNVFDKCSTLGTQATECQKATLCLNYPTKLNLNQIALNKNSYLYNLVSPEDSTTNIVSSGELNLFTKNSDLTHKDIKFSVKELVTIVATCQANFADEQDKKTCLDCLINKKSIFDYRKFVHSKYIEEITECIKKKDCKKKFKIKVNFADFISANIALLKPEYQSVTNINISDFNSAIYRSFFLNSYLNYNFSITNNAVDELFFDLKSYQNLLNIKPDLEPYWQEYLKKNNTVAENLRVLDKNIKPNQIVIENQNNFKKLNTLTASQNAALSGQDGFSFVPTISDQQAEAQTITNAIFTNADGSSTFTIGTVAISGTYGSSHNSYLCTSSDYFQALNLTPCITNLSNQKANIASLENYATIINGSKINNSLPINYFLCVTNNLQYYFNNTNLSGTQLNLSQQFENIMLGSIGSNFTSTPGSILNKNKVTGSVTQFFTTTGTSFSNEINNLYQPCCNQNTWNLLNTGLSIPSFCNTVCTGTNCLSCGTASTSLTKNCSNFTSYFANRYSTTAGSPIKVMPYPSQIDNLYGNTLLTGSQLGRCSTIGSQKEECVKANFCLYYPTLLRQNKLNLGLNALNYNLANALKNWNNTSTTFNTTAIVSDTKTMVANAFSSPPVQSGPYYYTPTAANPLPPVFNLNTTGTATRIGENNSYYNLSDMVNFYNTCSASNVCIPKNSSSSANAQPSNACISFCLNYLLSGKNFIGSTGSTLVQPAKQSQSKAEKPNSAIGCTTYNSSGSVTIGSTCKKYINNCILTTGTNIGGINTSCTSGLNTNFLNIIESSLGSTGKLTTLAPQYTTLGTNNLLYIDNISASNKSVILNQYINLKLMDISTNDISALCKNAGSGFQNDFTNIQNQSKTLAATMQEFGAFMMTGMGVMMGSHLISSLMKKSSLLINKAKKFWQARRVALDKAAADKAAAADQASGSDAAGSDAAGGDAAGGDAAAGQAAGGQAAGGQAAGGADSIDANLPVIEPATVVVPNTQVSSASLDGVLADTEATAEAAAAAEAATAAAAAAAAAAGVKGGELDD